MTAVLSLLQTPSQRSLGPTSGSITTRPKLDVIAATTAADKPSFITVICGGGFAKISMSQKLLEELSQ